jgi:hypothetical protein
MSACHAHAVTPDTPMLLTPIPTFWIYVLGSFQHFGTNPTIPLPLIQHLQCVTFLRLISKLLDFLPTVLSPFGLIVKFYSFQFQF